MKQARSPNNSRIQSNQHTACASATPKTKRVAFKPTGTLRTYSPRHVDTSALHYGKQDYRGFTRDIQALCLRARGLPHVRRAGAPILWSDDVTDASDRDGYESLRGLESLLFVERIEHKRRAQRALLKYQAVLQSRPGMTSEGRRAALVAASAGISARSAAVAALTARLDATTAYGEEGATSVGPRCVAETNALPFLSRRRHPMSDLGRDGEWSKEREAAKR